MTNTELQNRLMETNSAKAKMKARNMSDNPNSGGGFVFPAPPPGGGVIILNKAQISSLDLLCLIKTIYPQTRIVAGGLMSTVAAGP